MKLAIISDLHLEFDKQQPVPDPPKDYDVAILAGDISLGLSGIAWAQDTLPKDKPVLYLAGNHEYYHQDYDELNKLFNTLDFRNVKVLAPGAVEIGGVNFVGATLWSNLELQGYKYYPEKAYEYAIGDFQVIHSGESYFSAQKMKQTFFDEYNFIEDNLSHDKKNVVITHFLPSQECIVPFYEGNNLNPYFCNELDPIMESWDIAAWIYGHTHSPLDKKHSSGTRLICNPRGYPKERKEYYKWKVIDV